MARLRTPTADSLDGRIAREIRAEMGRQGLTQELLADKIGWSQRSLSRRLTADVPVTTADLMRIAQVLNVPLSQLLPTDADADSDAAADAA